MPGPLGARTHRSRGSWIPRLAGISVVVVLAGGGLAGYLASRHSPVPHMHHHAVLSTRVLTRQTVGIIDFGPEDDGDQVEHTAEDKPLMLQPVRGSLNFVPIPVAELKDGVPVWTADQMADHSEIFIYTATGDCLSAGPGQDQLRLAHCSLGDLQRWRPVDAASTLGQAIAKYQNARTGRCLTAPPKGPGPATLQQCGTPRQRTQEIAFWWGA
jgi:hypothetical protein